MIEIKVTLSANDLGHVFGTGHRYALGHVLALLVSRFFRESVGDTVVLNHGRGVHVVLAARQRGISLLLALFAVHV